MILTSGTPFVKERMSSPPRHGPNAARRETVFSRNGKEDSSAPRALLDKEALCCSRATD